MDSGWAAIIGAVVGGVLVGAVNLILGRLAERRAAREDWWTRFIWAMQLTRAPDAYDRDVGFIVFTHLVDSRLADAEERAIISDVTDRALAPWPAGSTLTESHIGTSCEQRRRRMAEINGNDEVVEITPDKVTAARLRIKLDRREKRSTPDWVVAIANAPSQAKRA